MTRIPTPKADRLREMRERNVKLAEARLAVAKWNYNEAKSALIAKRLRAVPDDKIDTTDIPEAGKSFFKKAKLKQPRRKAKRKGKR